MGALYMYLPIVFLHRYFPASSTQEMLDEWRPKLCPFDSATIAKAVEYFEWFLPVAVFPKEAHISYELWFHEFMNLWEVCHNAPIWEVVSVLCRMYFCVLFIFFKQKRTCYG